MQLDQTVCKQINQFLCPPLEVILPAKCWRKCLPFFLLFSFRIITYLYWQITEGRKIMIRLLHEQIINVSSVGPLSFSPLLTFYNGTSKLVPRQNSTMNPHLPATPPHRLSTFLYSCFMDTIPLPKISGLLYIES